MAPGRAWPVPVFLFLFGDGKPGGEGTGLFDGVAFFAALVFAVGEGVILGRDAIGEFEIAIRLLGRVERALGFLEELGVGRRHLGDGFTATDADHDFLDEGGAIEALAGFLPLLALELVEGDSGAGDGEFGLGLLFFGAMERSEPLEDAVEGGLGGGFVAVEESQFVEGFGRPERGIGLGGVECGFDGVEGALAAPEEPAADCGVFYEVAGVGGFGRVLSE